MDSDRFKRPFLHEAFGTSLARKRALGSDEPICSLGGHSPLCTAAASSPRYSGLACLPARSRSPANTSRLKHELLSQAFGNRAAWAQARFNKCGRGRAFPPDGFAPPQAPGRAGAGPGPRWASFISSPAERASAGANNVAPSPPLLPPKLRSFRLRTLAFPAGRSLEGGGAAGGAAGCRVPCAAPPPSAPARPPRPGREATSPAAEWKPVRQVTNRWLSPLFPNACAVAPRDTPS